MKVELYNNDKKYSSNLDSGTSLAVPMGKVRCFYATEFSMTPYRSGDFIGSVKAGAPVNFYDVQLNPHGNGTHTECLGHITENQECISDHLITHHFIAQVISITPKKLDNRDNVIDLEMLQQSDIDMHPALIIRTMPNSTEKLSRDYSGTNPPYITSEAMRYLVDLEIEHLLIDLPSVDREVDEGILASHHIFWGLEEGGKLRKQCTITEMVFIPDHIEDGTYLLNMQVAPFPMDAAPSNPIIYPLQKI